MHRLEKLFYSTQFLALIFCFFAACFIVCLFFRPLHIDTGWLGEQAYWLSQKGKVVSAYFSGYLDYETQQFVYHKLFIWLGSLIISLFDYQLPLLRGIALIGALALCASMIILMNQIQKKLANQNTYNTEKSASEHQNYLLLIIFFALFSNSIFAHFSFEFRPETWLMFLSTVIISFLIKALSTSAPPINLESQSHQKNPSRSSAYTAAVLAGITTGAAILIHLNALIYAVAGGLLLLKEKQWKLFITYGLACALTAALYFLDVIYQGTFATFIAQFQGDPALSDETMDLFSPFIKMLSEHKRYFRSEASISITLLICAILFFERQALVKHRILRHLAFFTGIAMLTLGAIAHSKTEKYMLLILPAALAIVITLALNSSSKIKLARRLTPLLALYCACQFSAYWNLWKGHLPEKDSIQAIATEFPELKKWITEKPNLSGQLLLAPIKLIAPLKPKQHYRSQTLLKLLLENKTPEPFQKIGFEPTSPSPGIIILDHPFWQRWQSQLPAAFQEWDYSTGTYHLFVAKRNNTSKPKSPLTQATR